MDDRDWQERLKKELDNNPILGAAVVGAFTIFALTFAARNSTPENRQKIKEARARYREEEAERRRRREQIDLGYRLRESYFKEGPGKDLYEARAWMTLEADPSFEDLVIKRTGGTYGKHGFEASSAAAGAQLFAMYAPYDGHGTCRLVRPDGSIRSAEAGFGIDALHVYPDDDLSSWTDDIRLMARLIAGPGSYCSRVKLLRPDHARIKEAIWAEYLSDNPHIASVIGAVEGDPII